MKPNKFWLLLMIFLVGGSWFNFIEKLIYLNFDNGDHPWPWSWMNFVAYLSIAVLSLVVVFMAYKQDKSNFYKTVSSVLSITAMVLLFFYIFCYLLGFYVGVGFYMGAFGAIIFPIVVYVLVRDSIPLAVLKSSSFKNIRKG